MVKTHKLLSNHPCIHCFSEELTVYLNNQYDESKSDLIFFYFMEMIEDEWESL